MTEGKKAKTTVYLNESALWKLREKAAQDRIATDSAAFEAAIDCWIEQGKSPVSPTRVNREDRRHQMLSAILESKNQDAILAVEQSLEVYNSYIRLKSEQAHDANRKTHKNKA